MSSAIAPQIADETYHVIEMRTRRDKVTQVPCRVTNLSSAARIEVNEFKYEVRIYLGFKKPNFKKPNFKKPDFKKSNFKKPNF